jgi:putative CRISPR-associated protein (TIGR02619 family)
MQTQRAALFAETLSNARSLSAEVNGILGIYENQIQQAKADLHILLHTDTLQGELAAHTLNDWLAKCEINAYCQRIERLNTENLEAFHEGINSLLHWAAETIPGYRQSGYNVVFNLVGGFKSFQGFMQSLGMFYADELVYIFESSNQLLRMPRLPVDLNHSARELLETHALVIRKLDAGLPINDLSAIVSLPETFLYRFGGEFDLSPWARLVWKQHKPNLYRSSPQPSISPLLVLSEKTVALASRLQPERLAIFNERMDDLAVYLEKGQKNCPKRLDFKQLKGNPCPPATHECDLWADADTQRAFGCFIRDKFHVEWIGRALH